MAVAVAEAPLVGEEFAMVDMLKALLRERQEKVEESLKCRNCGRRNTCERMGVLADGF